jgi:hypothetical protein
MYYESSYAFVTKWILVAALHTLQYLATDVHVDSVHAIAVLNQVNSCRSYPNVREIHQSSNPPMTPNNIQLYCYHVLLFVLLPSFLQTNHLHYRPRTVCNVASVPVVRHSCTFEMLLAKCAHLDVID